jgi:hypothetical protein
MRKHPNYASFGKRGGKKRMAGLSAEERSALARKAAFARAAKLTPFERREISRRATAVLQANAHVREWKTDRQAAKHFGLTLKEYLARKRQRILAQREAGFKTARMQRQVQKTLREALDRLSKVPVHRV